METLLIIILILSSLGFIYFRIKEINKRILIEKAFTELLKTYQEAREETKKEKAKYTAIKEAYTR